MWWPLVRGLSLPMPRRVWCSCVLLGMFPRAPCNKLQEKVISSSKVWRTVFRAKRAFEPGRSQGWRGEMGRWSGALNLWGMLPTWWGSHGWNQKWKQGCGRATRWPWQLWLGVTPTITMTSSRRWSTHTTPGCGRLNLLFSWQRPTLPMQLAACAALAEGERSGLLFWTTQLRSTRSWRSWTAQGMRGCCHTRSAKAIAKSRSALGDGEHGATPQHR